jgi:hypothetical protein
LLSNFAFNLKLRSCSTGLKLDALHAMRRPFGGLAPVHSDRHQWIQRFRAIMFVSDKACKEHLAAFMGVAVDDLTDEDIQRGAVRTMRHVTALMPELRELFVWGLNRVCPKQNVLLCSAVGPHTRSLSAPS